ncbi:MAG: VWA domain-containing protein, partial [Acidobacteria bacterium]|nr:VWA domain-containing protein [Acidobacteriota bacterium]
GKDLFQASIFPIPARSDKKLELTYTQVLRAESGTVSFRYPLGTGHNLTTVGRVSGAVEIEGREPVRNIYSPSHGVDVTRKGADGRLARVSFESGAGAAQKDFQLFYTLSGADFGLSLVTHREPGKDGYFLLTVSPKDDWAEAEYAAKDIVFVLDTSGSMAEEGKMEKARAALLFGVRSLRDADRFNVVSFAGEERLMEGGLIQADERGRARGVEFVQGLRATGGTNINGALLASVRQFDAGGDRPKILVFMTDGLPTVGETRAESIVGNVRAQRREGVRLFTFGVGYDVNTVLLDKLAAENGGASDYVEPREDIETKVSAFFAKVSYPVLTDLSLDWGGVEADLIYPRELPDLFRGTQVTLIGRYRNASDLRNVRLRLAGKTARETKSFAYENLRFPDRTDANDFLPRLWATRRVGWLMDQIRANGFSNELRDEIVDLGTRYGIVTPYTSYLALEPGFAGQEAIQVVPGRGAPGNRNTPLGQRPVARDSGVRTRVLDGASAGATAAPAPVPTRTDAEFKPDGKTPETALVFGSDEYFDLLKREPKLADYFALGERVVVLFKGRVYRVASSPTK